MRIFHCTIMAINKNIIVDGLYKEYNNFLLKSNYGREIAPACAFRSRLLEVVGGC